MSLFRNQKEEFMQRCAWRLVRSAEDRIGSGRGPEKLIWAVEAMKKEFPKLGEKAEDYVRAAFMNFKIEQRASLAY